MLRSHGMAVLAGTLLALSGCGSGETTPQAKTAPDGQAKPKSTDDTPDGAVTVFLEAVRGGDDAVAAEMLTKLARQKTEEMELVVAPPGGDDMKYEVGEIESLSDEIAHVACTWSDGDEHHDVVWALRKEKSGWRIAGMATQLEGVPLLLNFEDPKDMFLQQEAAEQEIARREEAAALQTRQANHEEAVPVEKSTNDASEGAENDESAGDGSPRRASRKAQQRSSERQR